MTCHLADAKLLSVPNGEYCQLGTNVSEISIKTQTFSFKEMHFKMSSAKSRQFCLGLNVLKLCQILFIVTCTDSCKQIDDIISVLYLYGTANDGAVIMWD